MPSDFMRGIVYKNATATICMLKWLYTQSCILKKNMLEKGKPEPIKDGQVEK